MVQRWVGTWADAVSAARSYEKYGFQVVGGSDLRTLIDLNSKPRQLLASSASFSP